MGLIYGDGMPYYEVPELTKEEKAMPASRFYKDYKLYPPNPLQQQILDEGPMDVEDGMENGTINILRAWQMDREIFVIRSGILWITGIINL